MRAAPLAFAVVTALLLPTCTLDPVQRDAVNALGKETPGGAGEFHRSGQPCGVCHQAGGNADTDFSVAGTIFAGPNNLIGVEGARVDLVDSAGTSPPLATPLLTNCVGNFYVKRSDWDPSFPVAVRISKAGSSRTMRSAVGRAASCADCHHAKIPLDDPFSEVPHVYLFDDQDPAGKAKVCPLDPDLRNQ
jgi:cytochrome c553